MTALGAALDACLRERQTSLLKREITVALAER